MLHSLEGTDRNAELLSLGCVEDRHLDQLLTHAEKLCGGSENTAIKRSGLQCATRIAIGEQGPRIRGPFNACDLLGGIVRGLRRHLNIRGRHGMYRITRRKQQEVSDVGVTHERTLLMPHRKDRLAGCNLGEPFFCDGIGATFRKQRHTDERGVDHRLCGSSAARLF